MRADRYMGPGGEVYYLFPVSLMEDNFHVTKTIFLLLLYLLFEIINEEK